ncbi:MAG: sugar ABC transporter permease [Pseudomonadota bacterium]
MSAALRGHPLAVAVLFLPSLLIVGVLVIYPLINGVSMSFTDSSPIYPDTNWIGFENYTYLLLDPLFWEVLWNSALMICSTIFAATVFGFALALLLNSGIRGANLMRTGVFQVWIVPWVAVAILWGWIFNADYGVLNYLMQTAGLIDEPLQWLNDPHLAQFSIVVGFTWRLIPFMMVVSLAAIQTIPRDLNDAAAVDGAGAWHRLRFITLPLVRNVLVVAGLLWGFRLFQEITLPWILTQGGPINATTTLSLFTYKIAFQQWDFGLASAAGTMWLLILVIFSVAYIRLMVRQR